MEVYYNALLFLKCQNRNCRDPNGASSRNEINVSARIQKQLGLFGAGGRERKEREGDRNRCRCGFRDAGFVRGPGAF